MKDYYHWAVHKSRLNSGADRPIGYKEGEIWWASIGFNIGFEEDGKGPQYTRPVIIVRIFSRQLFIGVPTTSVKHEGKFYYPFAINNERSYAVLSQIRAFDSIRLLRKMGELQPSDFARFKAMLRALIFGL